ncbi:Holliday junction branch migration protein RuvA [Bacteroidota bacterium]
MYEFITGDIVEKTPTYIVLETGNVGYYINISLFTYSLLPDQKPCQLFIHQIVREDAHVLFGFINREERNVFRQLISVSGVGANTARLILSSLGPKEIEQAINQGDVVSLQSIKGIGAKSAQRIIVDLQGKITIGAEGDQLFPEQSNTLQDQALSALVNLGFTRKTVEKVLGQILQGDDEFSVELLIKEALKKL